EYDMLPGATSERRRRNRTKIDGRTQEIQRLIGRSLRTVVDLEALGENSILIDCDVLQADGGTRTASVTGAYVAVCDAVRAAIRKKFIKKSPMLDAVAAVSVGRVDNRLLLDLDYPEDVTRVELDKLLRLASRGIRQLIELQGKALRKRLR
ncbi:MAG: ribonuclease PH, partial [Planctomycetota bacterium]